MIKTDGMNSIIDDIIITIIVSCEFNDIVTLVQVNKRFNGLSWNKSILNILILKYYPQSKKYITTFNELCEKYYVDHIHYRSLKYLKFEDCLYHSGQNGDIPLMETIFHSYIKNKNFNDIY